MLMHILFIPLIIKAIRFPFRPGSPTEGLEMGGIVDFDVLDGLEEFWEASRFLI